jgi:hypothetical protein
MTGRVPMLLLGGVLVIAGGWYLTQRLIEGVRPVVTPGTQSQGTAASSGGAGGVPVLQLEALGPGGDAGPTPARNPFRFERRRTAAADPAPVSVRQPAFDPPAPVVPRGPQGPPPIPLRYIGFLDEMDDRPRIAVLSDGRGSTFNGREGDIIDGRYRLERIGTESAELAYVDGRGRQTLRLSGQ